MARYLNADQRETIIWLDALNSLAYKDDSQIVSLTINKYYSEKPRVEVGIDKLKEGLL